MIADENNAAVFSGKSSHAVGLARYEQTIIHLIAFAANYVVFEALRQIENLLRIRNELAEAGVPRAAGQRRICRRCCSGHQQCLDESSSVEHEFWA